MTNTEWSYPSEQVSVLVNSQGKTRTVVKHGPGLGDTAAKYIVSGEGYTTTEHWIRDEAMEEAERSLAAESE